MSMSRQASVASKLKALSANPDAEKPDDFWREVEACGGTPIVQDDPTDPDKAIVTLLWRAPELDSKDEVYVVWDFKRYWDIPVTEEDRFKPVTGTDIQVMHVCLPRDLLTVYSLYRKPENVDIAYLTAEVKKAREEAKVAPSKQNISFVLKEKIDPALERDPLNAKIYSCNPDKRDGSRQSILIMPEVPWSEFVPLSAEEVTSQTKELTDHGKLFTMKADLSGTELSVPIGNLEVLSASLATFEAIAWEWQKKQDPESNAILLLQVSDSEWGVFRARGGAPATGKLFDHLKQYGTSHEAAKHLDTLKEDVNAFFNFRDYHVQLPENYDPDRNPPHPLLVVLDGQQYIDAGAPLAYDKMQHELNPPPVVVYLPAKGSMRITEYGCNDAFNDFLREFSLNLKAKYRTGESIILGASSGGQAAFYAGLKGIFDYVISESGALWGKFDGVSTFGSEMEDAFAEFVRKNGKTRFFMEAGTLETRVIADRPVSILEANRAMHDALVDEGFRKQCFYREYNGEHSFLSWMASFPGMLKRTCDDILLVRQLQADSISALMHRRASSDSAVSVNDAKSEEKSDMHRRHFSP